jgi:hypothetical protein
MTAFEFVLTFIAFVGASVLISQFMTSAATSDPAVELTQLRLVTTKLESELAAIKSSKEEKATLMAKLLQGGACSAYRPNPSSYKLLCILRSLFAGVDKEFWDTLPNMDDGVLVSVNIAACDLKAAANVINTQPHVDKGK